MKNPITLVLLLALSALFIAGCAEEQPPMAKNVKPRAKASPTPGEFRAVEKPQSYSQ